MRCHLIIPLALALRCASLYAAAEPPLVPDKPGSFQILSRTDYTSAKCGFTPAEVAANLKSITALVEVMRRNPVLADPTGFEGRARIYNIGCDDPDGYAVPARVSFEFSAWFVNRNGKTVFNDIEPPEWSLLVNKPHSYTVARFEADKSWFTVPGRMETLAPGVDVYDGEVFVVYNPDRPPYYLSMTVGEAFAKLKAYWGGPNPNDPFTSAQFLKMIDAQYAATPKADLDKPAHDRGGVGAAADAGLPRIVRVNPAYWDHGLSKGAIQILTFRMVRNRKLLEEQRAGALRNNSTSYPLYRFEESLDLESAKALLPLIGR